jgi:diguanylate cyclase (GGDEF)-like protein
VFGSQARVRRPVLLILLLGVLLVLVGVTATVQAVMVSTYASSSTLTAVVDSDVATVRGFIHDGLGGLDIAAPDAGTVRRIDDYLETLLSKGGIVHAEIRDADGRIIASSTGGTPDATPTRAERTADFAAAAAGSPTVDLVPNAESEAIGVTLPETVVREYLPLQQDGETVLVIGVWRDAEPVLAQLEGLRRDIVVVTLSGAVVAGGVLALVFRSAQRRINRQTDALVDATHRDALTESLNHGALVGYLAGEIERAHASGTPLGVALIDIDNFRLLNETHGHKAGDEALLTVSDILKRELPATTVVGRYGPDEFLVVAGHERVADLEPMVERLRTALADFSLQFDSTEQLPLTVSAGICTFPDHGSSVTDLLSTAVATLNEARASGGDGIRIAGLNAPDGQPGTSSFDIFQGLIFAVDAKDRYTKRHSEDVSRYGTFLASLLGLDPTVTETIRLAGLLHDVGKIGIPDGILRKPGRLTEDEFAVVRQHVALGDMIVRDLPGIDDIRAGIRHHHERWDGQGYLTGLARDDIPLVARILAVGDAFSAMTTTRPYRKALPLREALGRLGDAAGTQLDEALVAAFVRGIETAPDAPLPGLETSSALWSPWRRVA